MFVFKKSEPAVYHSEATGAEFKFRQSSEKDRIEFAGYVRFEKENFNDAILWAKYMYYPDNYYAAWLLESFSNVQQDGKALDIRDFNLHARADLIQKLKEADNKFSLWFKSHCEPPEKKTEEISIVGEVVEASALPAMQGQ